MDYPAEFTPTPVVINTFSKYFTRAYALGYVGSTTLSNGSTGSATTALMPFVMPSPYVIRSFFSANGTSSGNVNMGIYSAPSSTGACSLLVSIPATAMTGSTTLQLFTLATPYLLAPGSYYLALNNTGSGTFSGANVTADNAKLLGLSESLTAMGSTVTPSASVLLRYFLCGFSRLASGY
jgi:hypothetical protein